MFTHNRNAAKNVDAKTFVKRCLVKDEVVGDSLFFYVNVFCI